MQLVVIRYYIGRHIERIGIGSYRNEDRRVGSEIRVARAELAVNIVTSGATHTSSSHASGRLHFISLLRYFTEILARIHWCSPFGAQTTTRLLYSTIRVYTILYVRSHQADIAFLPVDFLGFCTDARSAPCVLTRECNSWLAAFLFKKILVFSLYVQHLSNEETNNEHERCSLLLFYAYPFYLFFFLHYCQRCKT